MKSLSCAGALALILAPASAAQSAPAVPAGALKAIAAVHAAAEAKDFDALRALMDESGFISSFGGEGGADEAIALWRQDPALLPQLARVTAQPCARVEDYVECPRGAEAGYRAGLKLNAGTWRMQWFLAGD